MLLVHRLDRLRELCLRGLVNEALVQDAIQLLDVAEAGDVVANDLVGCYDDVVRLILAEDHRPFARFASEEYWAEVGRKFSTYLRIS